MEKIETKRCSPTRIETLHCPFSLSKWNLGILRLVVQLFVRPMLDLWHDQTLGSGVGSELVSDHASGRNALLSEQRRQRTLSRLCVAAGPDDFVGNIAVLIDGSPRPTFLAINRNDDHVQMPDVAAAGRALSSAVNRLTDFRATMGRHDVHRTSSIRR